MRIFGLICVTVGVGWAVLAIALARLWVPVVRARCGPFNLAACGADLFPYGEVAIGGIIAAFGVVLLAIRPHRKKSTAA